jgi:hypothetical protein
MSNMCSRDYYASLLGTILALSDLQPIFFAGRRPNKSLGNRGPPSNDYTVQTHYRHHSIKGDSSKKGR